MTLNLHWHGLTNSQKRSVVAGVFGAAAWVVDNADGIRRFLTTFSLHDAKAAGATLIGLAALIITMRARGLDSRNSGTGSGLIDNGPDVKAAQAAQGDAP